MPIPVRVGINFTFRYFLLTHPGTILYKMSTKRKKSTSKKKSTASEKKHAQELINSLRAFADKTFGKNQPIIVQSFTFEGNVKNVILNTLYPEMLSKNNIQLKGGRHAA